MATSPRTISRSCWSAAIAGSLVATLAAAAPVDAAQPDGCTGIERRDALRMEQSEVLDLLSGHTTLRNLGDLALLGSPKVNPEAPQAPRAYNLLDHKFASARGIGFSVVDSLAINPVTPGAPDVLFYAPDPEATEEEVTEPDNPDFDYELVGWAYAAEYDFEERPMGLDGTDGRCITAADWFVHERSVHPFDTWQNVPAPPPDEEFHGADPGQQLPIPENECDPEPCPAGIQHGRLWDIHFWLDGAGNGVPSVSILNPRARILGWDPDVGVSFFFPERRPE